MATEKRLIDANALLEKVQFRMEIDNKNAEIIAGCVNIARRLIENAPTVDAVEVVRGQWIPVTERLPDKEFWEHQKQFEDEDLEVLVMIKGARLPTMLLYNAEGEFYEQHSDGQTFYIVTHWKPMPEPPETAG